MRNRTRVLLASAAGALMLLAACGDDTEQLDDASDASKSIDQMEDELGIDLDDFEELDEDVDDDDDPFGVQQIPEGFPEEVAIPDDREATTIIGNPEDGFTANFRSQQDPEELAEMYQSTFEDAGWDVETSFRSAEETGLEDLYTIDSGAGDGEGATVTVQLKEDGQTAIMVYTSGPHD